MHYLVGVTFDHKPTQEDVEVAMAPFDENPGLPIEYHSPLDNHEVEMRLHSYDILDLTSLLRSEDPYERICWSEDEGFYEIMTGNPDGHWDWWEVGGRWDNLMERSEDQSVMERNTFRVQEWNEQNIRSHAVILDGEWIDPDTSSQGWKRNRLGGWNFRERDRAGEVAVDKALSENPDLWIVGVDCHR